jgi:type IV pilus assembly protein PilW
MITSLMTRKAIKSRCKGITLVELMVAMALGIFLTLGVTTLYIDTKKNDSSGEALARIQESARAALDIIAREIRMTGFQGCADPRNVNLNIIAKNVPTTVFGESSLRGWEVDSANWADGTEFDGKAIEAAARIGSDVISIQRGVDLDINTDPEWVSNANLKILTNEQVFSKNQVVLVSNCENADLFRNTSASGASSGKQTLAHANDQNITNRLGTIYSKGGSVFTFSSVVFYVADTGREDARGNPIYALYRQTDDLDKDGGVFTTEELVEGVESMQILYGEKLSTDNIRYVPADTAGLNMQNVVSVRLGLLVSSTITARTSSDAQSYALPGETITGTSGKGTVTHAEDARLRKTFTQSVAIRNRG